MLRRLSIRVRLALLGSAVSALVVLGYAVLAVTFLERGLLDSLDQRLVIDAELLERSLLWDGERTRLVGAVEARPGAGFEDSLWSEVVDAEDRPLWRSPSLGARRLPAASERAFAGREFRTALLAGGVEVRLLILSEPIDGKPAVLKVARATEPHHREVGVVRTQLFLAAPAALLLALLGAWFLAGRALRPVERMREELEQVTAEQLSARLALPPARDELAKLAATVNGVLARLERSFETLRQFTSDASHELRTPLAAMRAELEVCLREARSAEDYRSALGSALEEISRMTQLVDQLLALSRDDDARAPIALHALDLRGLCAEIVGELEVLAEEKQQRLECSGDAAVMALADEPLLRRVLVNLVHNAIRYTPEGGHIEVRTERAADGVLVHVDDDGPGIAPEHRARVFDRFYRIDKSRSREHGGTGLGLAIARGAARRMQGTLDVAASPLGGARFTLALRAAEEGG
ncbi:MAG: HAMP domain-containing protein [Planctomycetes bacterium]|nr:HAMP domain-containing protein [Planctomycetota bacterium]